MSKHTPGPWQLDPETGYIESGFGEVALTCGWDNPDDETLPNGRLLTAAPELLEALELMLEANEGLLGESTWFDERLRLGWAAVAKARGIPMPQAFKPEGIR
jgi:hypothetical protein